MNRESHNRCVSIIDQQIRLRLSPQWKQQVFQAVRLDLGRAATADEVFLLMNNIVGQIDSIGTMLFKARNEKKQQPGVDLAAENKLRRTERG